MKSLADRWSEELDGVGQALRSAVLRDHSVSYWAEAVASIVASVPHGATTGPLTDGPGLVSPEGRRPRRDRGSRGGSRAAGSASRARS